MTTIERTTLGARRTPDVARLGCHLWQGRQWSGLGGAEWSWPRPQRSRTDLSKSHFPWPLGSIESGICISSATPLKSRVPIVNAPARPPHAAPPLSEPTVLMKDGWHCLHLYYKIQQRPLNLMTEAERSAAAAEACAILDPNRPGAPARLLTSVVAGHKADLCVLAMDFDPLKLEAIRHALRTSALGPALEPVYSYVSITEVSEYVPTVEQYGERLKAEGTDPASPAFAVKLKTYEEREVQMRKQRLFPEFPAWPVLCFYPMNKIRDPHANWYTLPYSSRMEMMTEHGKSGMKFGGKVMQVITASTGLDDWEWGVTLWGREPAYIKEIVYTMRFDEASANYGAFGPFYLSYILSPAEAMRHLRVVSS